MERVISEFYVKTRKPHHCWGCKIEYPAGTTMLRSVSADGGGGLTTCYWCYTCNKYLMEHRDMWQDGDGFDYGDMYNFDDYIPYSPLQHVEGDPQHP